MEGVIGSLVAHVEEHANQIRASLRLIRQNPQSQPTTLELVARGTELTGEAMVSFPA